jgi:translation initiation factor IF-3
MQHQEEGRRVLDMILEKLTDVSKVERPPAMDGRRMTALLTPKPGGAKPQPKAAAPTATV